MHDEVMRLLERAWGDRVVGPPAFAPILDQPGVLEHPEMKRQPGLPDIELVLKLADALFAIAKHVQRRKTRGVRQRMKERNGAIEIGSGRGGHGELLIKFS